MSVRAVVIVTMPITGGMTTVSQLPMPMKLTALHGGMTASAGNGEGLRDHTDVALVHVQLNADTESEIFFRTPPTFIGLGVCWVAFILAISWYAVLLTLTDWLIHRLID